MKNNEYLIEINDEPREDNRPTEVPRISIESVENPVSPSEATNSVSIVREDRKSRVWRRVAIILILLLTLILGLAGGFSYLYLQSDLTLLYSDSRNVELLSTPYDSGERIEAFGDSILGVAFDVYPLSGLRASLEAEVPDMTDSSLHSLRGLFFRRDPIGELVLNGQPVSSEYVQNKKRTGYGAISSDGRLEIGVSSSDGVQEHMIDSGGSFYRQFPLLASGQLPHAFQLHEKVERSSCTHP